LRRIDFIYYFSFFGFIEVRKMGRYIAKSWNGKWEVRFGKRWIKVIGDGISLKIDQKELEKQGKSWGEYIKEHVKPDIYHFGDVKIRYYLWMEDQEDFERAREYLKQMTEKKIKEGKLPPGTHAYLAIENETRIPVITYIGNNEKGTFIMKDYYP